MRFLRKLKSDRGEMVAAVIMLPLVIMLIVTGIDFGLYQTNMSKMSLVAKDSARTIAIFGGNGTATQQTAIEKQYGQTVATACNGVQISRTAHKTPAECNMLTGFKNAGFIGNVQVNSVSCSPDKAAKVGQQVECSVNWKYDSMPFSFLGLARNVFDKDKVPDITTKGLSSSEVSLGNSSLVAR